MRVMKYPVALLTEPRTVEQLFFKLENTQMLAQPARRIRYYGKCIIAVQRAQMRGSHQPGALRTAGHSLFGRVRYGNVLLAYMCLERLRKRKRCVRFFIKPTAVATPDTLLLLEVFPHQRSFLVHCAIAYRDFGPNWGSKSDQHG